MQPSTSLIDTAYELNNALEQNYLALAVVLSEINENEAWKEDYKDFVDFYTRGLGREKSTVSRLLTAGKWLRENGFADKLPAGNPTYKKLVASIKKNPDATPKKIISEALTWSDTDYKDDKKEKCTNPEYIQACKHCWSTPERHQ